MPPQNQPQPAQTPQPVSKEPRLKNHTIVFMLAVALLYDAITLVLPSIVAPVAGLHFWLWFKLHGISFMTPKRLGASTLGLLVEVFPLTSWIPAWTAAVAYIALNTRIKEKA